MKKIILPYSNVRADLNGSPMSGSSCDFSIAKLTVTYTGLSNAMSVYCANIDGGMAEPFIHIGAEETETFDIVLYKGKAVIDVNAAITLIDSYSGDIHLEGDPEYLVATGDGSITIKDNLA